ncbi:MAG: tRNA (adenosine(37)-N6)-threonylcarbamoyltransferase complex dimerization subunit type 1 TsaB [Bacteroidales bacterium]|nr:tRNA (adenosine(37)-N6)-threonylcarbamoyltransferase complex dimerization subunit type 1 TsaB [Bacteroidales bacterium]
MYILNIDTSGEICSVAIFERNHLLGYKETNEKNSHASQLAPLTNNLLKELNIKSNQLQAVAINKGPGSYTGLRIGTAFAKGLCYALNIPLIAVDGLKIIAQHFLTTHSHIKVDYICPMLDARRMEVYTAIFDTQLQQIMKTQTLVLNSDSFEQFSKFILAFVGNGVLKFKFLNNNPNASFLFFPEIYANALSLGLISPSYFEQQIFEDVAYFEPLYLKDFIPTTPKDKLL